MGKGRLNNWKWWLRTLSAGLLIFAAFAPLSETPDRVLMLVASGGLLISLSIDSLAFRKWVPRFLIPLAAFVLLALLLSIDPKLVFFGAIGVNSGAGLWDVVRREHAEYLLAEQDRPSVTPAAPDMGAVRRPK
jgi:hypothetical protein